MSIIYYLLKKAESQALTHARQALTFRVYRKIVRLGVYIIALRMLKS